MRNAALRTRHLHTASTPPPPTLAMQDPPPLQYLCYNFCSVSHSRSSHEAALRTLVGPVMLFFFFFILVISPSSASPPASELVLTNVLSCQGSFLLSFWARLCYCRHFEYLTKIISIAVFKKILLDLVSPKLEYAEPKPNHLLERCLLPKQLGSISGSGTLLIHPTPRVLPAFSKHGCCI